ncbi:hypothetical protein H4R34_000621 [Dimargaris verticillata]|uniref:Uncharacterized protein n=1 Tax=Dimargaris verticillata TaxID=2761393 RepID=A0A9W8EF77_9FUNG|nr:hypothetical protein H4R34_000621 [Dimargaris verticillata]
MFPSANQAGSNGGAESPEADQALALAFRQAALSVTDLYKKATTRNRRAYRAGYQQCLEDFAQFLSCHGAVPPRPTNMADNGGGDVQRLTIAWDDIVQFASIKQQQLEQYAPYSTGSEEHTAPQPPTASWEPPSGQTPHQPNIGAANMASDASFAHLDSSSITTNATQVPSGAVPAHVRSNAGTAMASTPTTAHSGATSRSIPPFSHSAASMHIAFPLPANTPFVFEPPSLAPSPLAPASFAMDSDMPGGIGTPISPDSLKRRLLTPLHQHPHHLHSHHLTNGGGGGQSMESPIFNWNGLFSGHPYKRSRRDSNANDIDDDEEL